MSFTYGFYFVSLLFYDVYAPQDKKLNLSHILPSRGHRFSDFEQQKAPKDLGLNHFALSREIGVGVSYKPELSEGQEGVSESKERRQ